MRIAVAVSGGVDSLCALLLLQRAGHEVVALHALLAEASAASLTPLPGLETACRALGVPLRVADLRDRFAREVVAPFAGAYARGRTPNPCALCNRHIKFGALLDAALELGAERLATGHYARIVDGTRAGAPGPLLARAAHAPKDQSYFLSLVPQERLRRVIFPLADMDKAACAALVAGAGLAVPVPQESHDICFAPGGVDAYREFLERKWQSLGLTPPGPGPILLREDDPPAGALPEKLMAAGENAGERRPLRHIGIHAGLWRYTEGQRRGLGIAHAEALHVLRKDVAANTLVVGPRRLLGMRGCVAGDVNVAVDPRFWPRRPLVRCRYGGGLAAATVRLEGARLCISFAEACFPTAAGQVATLYDEDGVVLAGAIVEEALA
ncbi:tRNA methyl transferase PRC-barrel domain-containing protein [Desulfovibrio sp.]|uniref:MnmA/TRMU family protein n=1 Tax=Desulfovibrio sp. TaxID=885 RepID=UPI0023D22677|nr:tRNA methyl transferase PRC-barrel domain-containing protein [Desulfovibrio sp.]MDE7240375.1 tRNA 2-thiouridine(34) synthase MnmA [Desulfovibrio sp.]